MKDENIFIKCVYHESGCIAKLSYQDSGDPVYTAQCGAIFTRDYAEIEKGLKPFTESFDPLAGPEDEIKAEIKPEPKKVIVQNKDLEPEETEFEELLEEKNNIVDLSVSEQG